MPDPVIFIFGGSVPPLVQPPPPDAQLLVFDNTPEQHRFVLHWVEKVWNKSDALYCVKIPCTPNNGCLFDWVNEGCKLPFKGRLDDYPANYFFRVELLDIECVELGARTEPFLLPDMASGLSLVQRVAYKMLRDRAYTRAALVEQVAYDALVTTKDVSAQLDSMERMGLIEGKVLVRATKLNYAALPLVLMDRLSLDKVKEILFGYIQYEPTYKAKLDEMLPGPVRLWGKEYASASLYFDDWLPLFLTDKLDKLYFWPEHKLNFLRLLYVKDKFKMTDGDYGLSPIRCKFFDEPLEHKRDRIRSEGIPEEYVERIMEIPICEIGPECENPGMDEAIYKNVRDEWMKELNTL